MFSLYVPGRPRLRRRGTGPHSVLFYYRMVLNTWPEQTPPFMMTDPSVEAGEDNFVASVW